MDSNELAKKLEKYPHIKARLEVLISVAENSSGEFKRADDAEDALAEGIRQMGQDLLQAWAIVQNADAEIEARNNSNLKCHSKKNFTGKQHSEKLK
jgi:hypothetical protein